MKKEFSFEDAVKLLFKHNSKITDLEARATKLDEDFKKNDLAHRVEVLEAAIKK